MMLNVLFLSFNDHFTYMRFFTNHIKDCIVTAKAAVTVMAVVMAAGTQVQAQDYSNYQKLDSIVYPIYPYSRSDYKYEFSYDKDGNQIGYVQCLRNNDFLRKSHSFTFANNEDISSYTVEAVNDRGVHKPSTNGRFDHYSDGKLLSMDQSAPRFLDGVNISRVFDETGRPTRFVREDKSRDGFSSCEIESIQYDDNGKIREFSWTFQRYTYDFDFVSGDLIKKYTSNEERKWFFNSDGLLGSEFEFVSTFNQEYDITETWESEKYYGFMEENHSSCVGRFRRSIDREDEAFIESIGGREVYERDYNTWSEYETTYYKSNSTYDANGRISLRETFVTDRDYEYTGELAFTEEFSYDANGNVSSRDYKYGHLPYSVIIGFNEAYSYDENNRLIKEVVKWWWSESSDETVYDLEYWYDENGQKQVKEERKSKTMPEPSSIKEYDDRGNLIVEIASSYGNTYRYDYTYDEIGNMSGVTVHLNGELSEKIEYDTTIPSFKTGGTLNVYDYVTYSTYYNDLQQARYSDSHLFYLFDQPFKVKSYKYYDMGEEREAQLYYSKFIDEDSIDNITIDNDSDVIYYDLQGRRYSSPVKGVNIMKKGDKTMKIIR